MNAPPMMGAPPMMMAPVTKEKTARPLIAGVMYIFSLIIGLYFLPVGIALLGAGSLAAASGLPFAGMLGAIGAILGIMIILGVVGSLLAVIACFTRKMFVLGLIGGLLAFAGLHFFFGLIGFILFATSKEQFS
jgi:hypothetical protein